MCNLSEIILEEGIVKGKTQTLCELVQQGELSIYAAAKYMGIDAKTFVDMAIQRGYRFCHEDFVSS